MEYTIEKAKKKMEAVTDMVKQLEKFVFKQANW